MSGYKNEMMSYILEQISGRFGDRTEESLSRDIDIDLIGSGIISSLEFIELISDIETKFNIEIDFEDFDPSEFTTLSGLIMMATKARSE